MISEQELALTASSHFKREWRISVGPPRGYVLHSLFRVGEPVELPDSTTTLDEVVNSTTSFRVFSVVGFPASGTVILRAGTDHAGWWAFGGVDYATNELLEVRFLSGFTHQPAGTSVTIFADISERVTSPPIINEWEEENAYNWSADIAGVRYNSNFMPPDASILIECRTLSQFGEWSSWFIAALGYVRKWEIEGDKDRLRSWQATVESVRSYVDPHYITARQYGRQNLAAGTSVSVSDTLGSPILEPAEFAGGLASIQPSHLTDENLDTKWISAAIPSAEAAEEWGEGDSDQDLLIDEIMTRGPIGAPADLQYIVIRMPRYSNDYIEGGSKGLKYFFLATKQTTWWEGELDRNYIRLPEEELSQDSQVIVLCRNRQIFESYYGVTSAVFVYEWRNLRAFGTVSQWTGQSLPSANIVLDPAGDFVALYSKYPNVGERLVDKVEWGPGKVPVAARGHSIRRSPISYDTNQHSDWIEEQYPVPVENRAHPQDHVWVQVEIPLFTCVLQNDLGISTTLIELSDATPLDESGIIQINFEQISYTNRTLSTIKVLERGISDSVASSHSAGAMIYQVTDGEAHRRYRLEAAELRRQRILAADGSYVVPSLLSVWGSKKESPIELGGQNYRLDWEGGNSLYWIRNNASTIISAPLFGHQYRHVAFLIRQMSDYGRAKLNDIYIWRAGAVGILNNEQGAGAIIRDLLELVLETSEIVIEASAFVGTCADKLIRESDLGSVINGILEESFCLINYTLDGKVILQRKPNHPLAPRPEVIASLDYEHIQSPHSSNQVSRLGASKVIVEIDDPASNEHFEAAFPPRGNNGDVERVNLRLEAGSEAMAAMMAQAIYLADTSNSRTYQGKTVGPAPWLHVGQRIFLRNISDEADGWHGRLIQYRIVSVKHGGEEGVEEFEAVEWRMA